MRFRLIDGQTNQVEVHISDHQAPVVLQHGDTIKLTYSISIGVTQIGSDTEWIAEAAEWLTNLLRERPWDTFSTSAIHEEYRREFIHRRDHAGLEDDLDKLGKLGKLLGFRKRNVWSLPPEHPLAVTISPPGSDSPSWI